MARHFVVVCRHGTILGKCQCDPMGEPRTVRQCKCPGVPWCFQVFRAKKGTANDRAAT